MVGCLVLFLYPYKLTRFFMPLIPLLLLAMLVGLGWLLRSRPRAAAVASMLLCLPILAQTALVARSDVARAERCPRATAAVTGECYSPVAQAFMAASRFAAESLPPGAPVLTIKEAPFFYYTGHPAMHPELPDTHAPDHYLEFIQARGVHYILLSAYPGGSRPADRLGKDCKDLELLFSAEPRTYLLHVVQAGEPPPVRDGCAPVTALFERNEEFRRQRKAGY
jgi:hypothetical protein